MVRMSESLGALVSVTGSSVSSAAGISVRQAFLAPEMGIEPCSRWPPCTRMLSMFCLLPLFLAALGIPLRGGVARPLLRLAPGEVGAERGGQAVGFLLFARRPGGLGRGCPLRHDASYRKGRRGPERA